jgi:hypothetical protein
MDASRLEELLSDIWAYAFAVLDRELELTGEDAGKIATADEDGARRAALTLPRRFRCTSVEAAAGRKRQSRPAEWPGSPNSAIIRHRKHHTRVYPTVPSIARCTRAEARDFLPALRSMATSTFSTLRASSGFRRSIPPDTPASTNERTFTSPRRFK